MEEERPVRPVHELDAVGAADRGQNALEMRGISRQHRHVADLVIRLDADEVDGAEQALGPAIAASAAKAPGWFSSRTRIVALNEAD